MNLLLWRVARWPVLVALMMGAAVAVQGPATAADDSSRLDEFVADHRGRTGTPGLAYAVVGPRGIEHLKGFGVDGDGGAITAGSRFLWGSVSKPVAATVVLGLVRDGALGLDDRVVGRLPSFRVGENRSSARITIRQLLEHTSGLPPALEVTDRDEARQSPADRLRELRELTLVDQPGESHHYSSANYLVLSAVVEEITGRPYADVLTDEVLGPLGMADVITSSAEAQQDLPPGHRYVAGHSVAFDSPFDPAGLGYGYLGGTIDDLARFARAQLGGDPDVVTDSDRSQMQAAAVSTGRGGTYGMGWRQNTLDDFDIDSDVPIVWHSGAVPGYQSAVVVMPEQQRAVVMLQNSYGFFQEDALLDAPMGVAAILAGSEPASAPGAGMTYPGLLIALTLIAAAFTVVAIRSAIRVVRPRRSRSSRRAAWGLGGTLVLSGAVVYLLAVMLPSLAGLPLRRLPLWAPDVGWLAILGVATGVVAALLRVVVAIRESRYAVGS